MVTANNLNTKNPLVQAVYVSTSSLVTCTSHIPTDDTIPQNTEGTEVLTVTITPRSTTSILKFTSVITAGNGSNSAGYTQALFQDTTDNALAAKISKIEINSAGTQVMQHVMPAGTTSSTTFKIRVGSHNEDANYSVYINGDPSGNRFLGGVSGTYLIIEEFYNY